MIGYSYDFQGYFTTTTILQPNPLKVGEYILPASCTDIAPPDQSTYTADQIPFFNEDAGQWELVKSPSKIAADAALLATKNSAGVSLYEIDVNGDVVLRDQAAVDAETLAANNEVALLQAKQLMDINIINKAKEITGGSTIDSASAFFQAYILRATNPSEYINDGLVAHYTNGSYNAGDALDTEAKITEYYTGLNILMDKFRNTEIVNYLAIKASLGF